MHASFNLSNLSSLPNQAPLYVFHGANVYRNGKFSPFDFSVSKGRISLDASTAHPNACHINLPNLFISPSFCDVHVHFREPGFEYKETIATGSSSAAAGGYTDVCSMPNLNPVPDSLVHLQPQLDAIRRSSVIHTHPFASISLNQAGKTLSPFSELAPFVPGFSDDGHGVQDAALMRQAMLSAASLDKPIVAHCEVNELVRNGIINQSNLSSILQIPGISNDSEWKMIERDLALVCETKCRYHVCHVSTAESINLIRQAKASGLPVTCETAPHYLSLTDCDLAPHLQSPFSGNCKMNPPIRSFHDREALRSALNDGTIDCIATDHAPHSLEEKDRGLSGPFGIVGLETAFPVLYTDLVQTNISSLETIIDRLAVRPRSVFRIPGLCNFNEGDPASFTIFGTDSFCPCGYIIDPSSFLSKGRSSPFAGKYVAAKIVLTMMDGAILHSANIPPSLL